MPSPPRIKPLCSPTRIARIRPADSASMSQRATASTTSITSGRASPALHMIRSFSSTGSTTVSGRLRVYTDTIRDGAALQDKSLALSPSAFRLVWCSVVVVSVVTSLFACILAVVYYGAMVIRGGYMIEGSGLLALQQIPFVVAAYACVAVQFAHVALRAVVASLSARRLLFKAVPPLSSVDSQGSTRSRPSLWHRLNVLARWRALFEEDGPLGMTPETFELVFLVREIMEVATQSYQAYKCSKLIAQPWINRIYVGTLVLNCWIAPLIHVRTRHDPALQRFLYLCSDVFLDVTATLGVPLCIIFSVVAAAFTTNLRLASGQMEFAFDVPSDDVAFMNTLKAVQQVFVVSWFDFATKMLPFFSMASCLSQIQRHVQPSDPATKALAATVSTVASPRKLAVFSVSPRLTRSLTVRVQKTIQASQRARRRVQWICQTPLMRRLLSVNVVHSVFCLWGVLLVAFHIQGWLGAHVVSTEMGSVIGCKSSSRPWFVHKFSCTILEINCYRHGFVGDASEIASALSKVDALGISSLIISHCPRLTMPSEIQSLTHLVGLEIYNSTLVEWGTDAALVQSKLPDLQYLSLLRVNMTQLPAGVQAVDFPMRLRDIVIASSNLTTLPLDLHTKWHRLLNLYVEHTQITEFPTTLAKMKPQRFSLMGNRIERIEEDAFPTDASVHVLSIAMNPIAKWPATIGDVSELYLVLMDYTNIDELPEWLTREGERRAAATTMGVEITVSAGGSRYCEHRKGAVVRERFPGLRVVCRAKTMQEIEACPLDFYYLQARVP